jgi:hypothetical protein
MRLNLIVIAVSCLALFAWGCDKNNSGGEEGAAEGGAAEGETCSADGDCASGTCLDLSQLDDGCSGMVCVVACENNEDCTLEDDGDCEGIRGDARICVYGGWETQYCSN